MIIQVTYFNEGNHYKPVSTTIEVPSTYSFYKMKAYYLHRAKQNICAARYWTFEDMEKYGYINFKVRIVSPREK